MKPTKESVLADAMTLNEEDRIELADLLHQEASDLLDDPEVEAAWGEEIKRRIENRQTGHTTPISWERVQAQGRRMLNDPAA